MVHVTFYYTADQRNVIYKTLTSQLTTTAELYENTDIFNPGLLLAWNNNYATTYNYFYIQEFNRYYFLDDVVAEPGGAARVKGSIDVLYTYRTSIGLDTIDITRAYLSKPWNQFQEGADPFDISSSAIGPTYVKDPQLPVHPHREIKTYPLYNQQVVFNLANASPTSRNFVLNVMGRTPS